MTRTKLDHVTVVCPQCKQGQYHPTMENNLDGDGFLLFGDCPECKQVIAIVCEEGVIITPCKANEVVI
jgi:phage FluMu protein Com